MERIDKSNSVILADYFIKPENHLMFRGVLGRFHVNDTTAPLPAGNNPFLLKLLPYPRDSIQLK